MGMIRNKNVSESSNPKVPIGASGGASSTEVVLNGFRLTRYRVIRLDSNDKAIQGCG